MKKSGIQKVIDHFGSINEVAIFTGCTYANVYHWVRSGVIPWDHALEIARETGIKPESLNPGLKGVSV